MFLIIVTILLAMFATGIGKLSKDSYSEAGAVLMVLGGVPLFFITLIFVWGSVKWEPNAKQLTGYVYQRQAQHGYVDYSLRFSQNAGMDEQPSFCTKEGSAEDQAIQQYVGTDTKVQINVAPRQLTWGPFWECNSFAEFDKVIKEDAKQ